MKQSTLRNTIAGFTITSALCLGSFAAQAANYTIDPGHSFIEFKTKHLGMSWLSGRFNKFEGTMKYDPAAGADAQSINIKIDTSSIDSNHEKRDAHLRSKDFFNTDSNAVATFASTGFSGDANGGTLTGDLTLLGVKKSISFPIKKLGEGKDPWGGYRVGFEGQYTLTRKDFGMDFNLGPQAEKVELNLLIEAIKDK